MKLKNIWRITLVIMILTTSLPAISSNITSDPTKTCNPAKNTELRAQQLMQRWQNINASGKSELTKLDKKNLRKEVKEIKKERLPIKVVFIFLLVQLL